ncbi:hypothetical protein [Maribacter spongiicola]|uniref:hypothetical protein n=1 Tax=Maribacter spongiicola TaxID=1206753 RepID=UPI003F99C480
MKKLSMLVFSIFCIGFISCRDNKQKQLDNTLDKIEAVEQEMDETTEEINQKSEDAKAALSELDSI